MIVAITNIVFALMTAVITGFIVIGLPIMLYLFIKRYKSNIKVNTRVPDGLSHKEERKFEKIQDIKVTVYTIISVFILLPLVGFIVNSSPMLSEISYGLFLFLVGAMFLAVISMFIGGFRR